MKKLWKKISYLGIEGDKYGLDNLSKILFNQINVIIMAIMLILLIILRIVSLYDHGPLGIGSLRVLMVFIVTFINLILSKYKKHNLSKFLLIILPPIGFILFPTLIGFVEEESFNYYPYVIIAFSIIPQLILIPQKDRTLFRISIAFYFILVVLIDQLLIFFSPENYIIIDRIKSFYVFYKVSQISIFIFINSSVYYLRKLNTEYDHRVNLKNVLLDRQNDELIKAFDNLKQAQDQLIRSEKMAALGTLTAGVAHEINNPLNFISGGLNIINEQIKDSDSKGQLIDKNILKENLDIIETGLNRASKILKSLMIFSYHGKSEIKSTDIHKIIESVLTFLYSKTKYQIKIIKDFRLDKNIPVYIDKIHQVFMNIIDNAIYELRFNSHDNSKKFIKIKTENIIKENKEYALIEICNNGPKIPVDMINNIFDPFFTSKDVGEGTGLGLSICYSIIKEHKGEIEVINAEEGVCFSIILPLILEKMSQV